MTEPGVPFPTIDDGDEELARKYGFHRQFDLDAILKKIQAAANPVAHHRQLGVGTYTAQAIAGVVTITATGTAPNLNTIVELAQLPYMIFPPQFGLFFTDQEFTLPATKPFTRTAKLLTQARLETIVVYDRDGAHAVPVENF